MKAVLYMTSDEAVDLGQPGGDLVVLTSADTEVALLAAAVRSRHQAGQMLDVRIANYLSLTHPYSVDLYIQNTIAVARLVVVRFLVAQPIELWHSNAGAC